MYDARTLGPAFLAFALIAILAADATPAVADTIEVICGLPDPLSCVRIRWGNDCDGDICIDAVPIPDEVRAR